MTPKQEKALEMAVADELDVLLPEEEDTGWEMVGFVVLCVSLALAGGVGFMLGAAWRGAQMVGGFHG